MIFDIDGHSILYVLSRVKLFVTFIGRFEFVHLPSRGIANLIIVL